MTTMMKIRALKLFASTSSGDVGRTIHFHDGLNVLRADNSSGKSTALQGIVYALGLEGMLSASQRIPLPHAMTDSVSVGGLESAVVTSYVELEISNAEGNVITARRAVVDLVRNKHLVNVTLGAAITSPNSDYGQADYFVRQPGAAQNEAGFHRFLTEFLGLDLPRVRKMDGSEVPLYLETLFPYFYVEQKHGWSGIQARIPTYLGIREVGKRSAEYILGLEAFDRIQLREHLGSRLSEIEAMWQSKGKGLSEVAKVSRMIIQNTDGRISRGLSDADYIPLAAIDRDWVTLPTALEKIRQELIVLSSGESVSVGEESTRLETSLFELEAGLQQTLVMAAGLAEERSELVRQLNAVNTRLLALDEDLQRHKDSLILQTYGSIHAHSLMEENHLCPTCHQAVDEGAEIATHAMTIAENVDFIQRQIATFKGMKVDLQRVIEAITIRHSSLTTQAHDYRREIRIYKDSLTSANSTPSVTQITRKVMLEERREAILEAQVASQQIRDELVTLSNLWRELKAELGTLSGGDLSISDKEKLKAIERSVRTQLEQYGFRSLKPIDIDISGETYRPANDGFDLGFDLSASDMIRVIWAYLFAVLEIGVREGNHFGLLIFDEPRQQETARESYQALLRNASTHGTLGAQVIFATSETEDNLVGMLSGSTYSLTSLPAGEKLLLPLT
ncbi:MAG: AAA family ATPase [Candidatus Nanopelagicaceae bacterium]|nr:AAA family ATPase [Candidatus Nanopelagicaceae bacterium]